MRCCVELIFGVDLQQKRMKSRMTGTEQNIIGSDVSVAPEVLANLSSSVVMALAKFSCPLR